jgi:hypothetical protein
MLMTYDHNAVVQALQPINLMPNSFTMGEYSALIRVNGRRSVVRSGHTVTEAERNCIAQAKETWPHHAHIFDLMDRKPRASM